MVVVQIDLFFLFVFSILRSDFAAFLSDAA